MIPQLLYLLRIAAKYLPFLEEQRLLAGRAAVEEAMQREDSGPFVLSLCARYRFDYLRAKEQANAGAEVWAMWSGNGPEDFNRGWYSAWAGLPAENGVETDYCAGWNAYCTHHHQPQRRITEDFSDEPLMRWLPSVRYGGPESRSRVVESTDAGDSPPTAARRKRTIPDLQRIMKGPDDG